MKQTIEIEEKIFAENENENEKKTMLMKSRFLACCIICIQWILLVVLVFFIIVQKQFILFYFWFYFVIFRRARSIWSVDFLHFEIPLPFWWLSSTHTYCLSLCVRTCAHSYTHTQYLCVCIAISIVLYLFSLFLLFFSKQKSITLKSLNLDRFCVFVVVVAK